MRLRLHLLMAAFALVQGTHVHTAAARFAGDERSSIAVLGASDVFGVEDLAAIVRYEHQDGWGKLWVEALPNAEPELAMFAAGYLEGYLTRNDVEAAFANAYADWFTDGDGPRVANATAVYDWLDANLAWLRSRGSTTGSDGVGDASPSGLFWPRAQLVLAQLDGLAAGLEAAGSKLDSRDVLLLNADGDLEELVSMLGTPPRPRRRDRCSALVKLTENRSDLIFGHTTWDHYGMMVRSLKSYDLRLRGMPRSTVVFSSTPGLLSSLDDFFLTSAGLAVIETTNGLSNPGLWANISTSSAPAWLRSVVANSLASSGAEWAELFSVANSGTYNNQWMVLDLKLFESGRNLVPGTFTLLEQIPGYVEWRDMSAHLDAATYWGSYNVPFFDDIYTLSGFALPSTHDSVPRANIFRQRQAAVRDLEGFQRLIRYNDWRRDPLSLGDACNAISSRCDLNGVSEPSWQLDGGIDAKATTASMALDLAFVAQNGPTADQQEPFRWRTVPPDKTITHVGEADAFLFAWTAFGPKPAGEGLAEERVANGEERVSHSVGYLFFFVAATLVALFRAAQPRQQKPKAREPLLSA